MENQETAITKIPQSPNQDQFIQLPTVGRIVHFYPNEWAKANLLKEKLNGATFLPAIVTQVFANTGTYSLLCNLSVFTPFSGNVGMGSVQHKSQALGAATTDQEPNSYWDWPPRA